MTSGNSQDNSQKNAPAQPTAPNASQNTAEQPQSAVTQTLDYQFYHRACELAGEVPSESIFTAGQAEGKFRFTEDVTLLNSLLTLYNLNLHEIAGEWTVFARKTGQVTVFASTPLEAVLTWVVAQPLALLTG